MQKSLHEVMQPSDVSKLNIENKDCGIIFKADGQYFAFAGSIDDAELSKGPDQMKPETLIQIANGRKLLALSLAIGNDQIMDILYDVIAQVTGDSDAQIGSIH